MTFVLLWQSLLLSSSSTSFYKSTVCCVICDPNLGLARLNDTCLWTGMSMSACSNLQRIIFLTPANCSYNLGSVTLGEQCSCQHVLCKSMLYLKWNKWNEINIKLQSLLSTYYVSGIQMGVKYKVLWDLHGSCLWGVCTFGRKCHQDAWRESVKVCADPQQDAWASLDKHQGRLQQRRAAPLRHQESVTAKPEKRGKRSHAFEGSEPQGSSKGMAFSVVSMRAGEGKPWGRKERRAAFKRGHAGTSSTC